MNKIILIGNSCRDCELTTAGNTQYSRISLAVGRSYNRDKTDFFNCTAFGKLAEIVAQYVKKGTKIAVSGRMEFSEDKDGNRHHTVIVEEMELLGGGKKKDDDFQPGTVEGDLPF